MSISILVGDCRDVLAGLPEASVQCCVTSPPYFGLRDYGHADQIGLEATPDAYVAEMVAVFREVRRVLREDGTLWLNIGDSYAPVNRGENARPRVETLAGMQANNPHSDIPTRREVISGVKSAGIKQKDLMGIPWMLAFALRADGWYLRQDIIWHKPNPMPESVQDRCTKAHEYVFLLSKSDRYFYDAKAIAEPANYAGKRDTARQGEFRGKGPIPGSGQSSFRAITERRNRRSVWPISTQPFAGAHFATMPPTLADLCIRAGSRPDDMVLDPFGGAGTTGLVANRLGRSATLIELNPAYAALARERINSEAGLFAPAAE